MLVKDVMTKTVITVTPETRVTEIANTMVSAGISGLPVVDPRGKVIGIVSEGDLMRRAETETAHRRSWWLTLFGSSEGTAQRYIRTHAMKAADLMSRSIVSVHSDDTLETVANLLEEHRIKRVPVIDNGQLVGIVSRSNLVQALSAIYAARPPAPSMNDTQLRAEVERHIEDTGVPAFYLNVVVANGVVDLWGVVSTRDEADALRVAAESVRGVKSVSMHVTANAQLLSGV
ncbi:MAG: CBS domain-containing protein [Alphaproteobacteria bacterium]|nr:CBS domain-containing protein [Alphaproteobacteria bacterium]MCB9929835.1 CBS domain-containing protein [Alphaproteobacteria bacterium]